MPMRPVVDIRLFAVRWDRFEIPSHAGVSGNQAGMLDADHCGLVGIRNRIALLTTAGDGRTRLRRSGRLQAGLRGGSGRSPMLSGGSSRWASISSVAGYCLLTSVDINDIWILPCRARF